MNPSVFVNHTACPKCMSRDNLGVYSDGHEYCFGCGYYKPPTKYIAAIEHTKVKPKVPIAYEHGNRFLPRRAWAWLEKGGITAEHLRRHDIRWSNVNQSLFIPLNHLYDHPVFTEKTFNEGEPKYRTHGNVRNILPYCPEGLSLNFLVLVEDALSALRISKYVPAAPLLGTTPHKHLVQYAVDRGNSLLLWLDSNKASDSLKWTETAKLMYPDIFIRSIISVKDPKEYNDDEILQFIHTTSWIKDRGESTFQPDSSRFQ